MIIQFTLQELMFFLLGALGIVAGIILLSILWNIKKMVGGTMPGIIENAEHISSNVRETTDRLRVSVPIIIQEVEYVTNAAKGSIEMAGAVMETMGSGINETVAAYRKDTPNIMDYLHIIEEVLQILYRTFSRSK